MPPSTNDHTGFPRIGMQILSQIMYLLGVSLLSHFISRRLRHEDMSSWSGLSQISLPRLLAVLTFIDSWMFMFMSGILIQGAGMDSNALVCSLGVFTCIVFYATSKLFIYLFLVEKVHVVWSPTPGTSRFKSPVYVTCFILVSLYVVIGINMIVARISYFRDDGACVIGLKKAGSIALLSYDLFLNIFLTSLFLWPLIRARIRNLHIRKVANRAVWAAVVALTSSCVNILVLTLMNGQQLAWVCLGSCGLDVIVNASVIFWVTSGHSLRPHTSIAREGIGAADGPFIQSDRFLYLSPKDIQRLSLQNTSSPSIAVEDISPRTEFSPSISFSDWDWELNGHQEGCKSSKSEDSIEPVTVPDQARTPGRTVRASFVTLPPLFHRRNLDSPTDFQNGSLMTQSDFSTQFGALILSPTPSIHDEDRDMFELVAELRGNSPTVGVQWTRDAPEGGSMV